MYIKDMVDKNQQIKKQKKEPATMANTKNQKPQKAKQTDDAAAIAKKMQEKSDEGCMFC